MHFFCLEKYKFLQRQNKKKLKNPVTNEPRPWEHASHIWSTSLMLYFIFFTEQMFMSTVC